MLQFFSQRQRAPFDPSLERLKVMVCGLSEVRWEGQGHFTTVEGHIMVYSGAEKQEQHGVAIWTVMGTS